MTPKRTTGDVREPERIDEDEGPFKVSKNPCPSYGWDVAAEGYWHAADTEEEARDIADLLNTGWRRGQNDLTARVSDLETRLAAAERERDEAHDFIVLAYLRRAWIEAMHDGNTPVRAESEVASTGLAALAVTTSLARLKAKGLAIVGADGRWRSTAPGIEAL